MTHPMLLVRNVEFMPDNPLAHPLQAQPMDRLVRVTPLQLPILASNLLTNLSKYTTLCHRAFPQAQYLATRPHSRTEPRLLHKPAIKLRQIWFPPLSHNKLMVHPDKVMHQMYLA